MWEGSGESEKKLIHKAEKERKRTGLDVYSLFIQCQKKKMDNCQRTLIFLTYIL